MIVEMKMIVHPGQSAISIPTMGIELQFNLTADYPVEISVGELPDTEKKLFDRVRKLKEYITELEGQLPEQYPNG